MTIKISDEQIKQMDNLWVAYLKTKYGYDVEITRSVKDHKKELKEFLEKALKKYGTVGYGAYRFTKSSSGKSVIVTHLYLDHSWCFPIVQKGVSK